MQLAAAYPLIYRVLAPLFPHCLWHGDRASRQVALTFDDGPHPHHTQPLLDVLDRYAVRASFFWLGQCVRRAPEPAMEVYQRGHWLGLHGYSHRSFARLSKAQLKDSLEQTQQAIAHACQLNLTYVQHHIRDVRPPNGFFTPKTLACLNQWGYRPVMWSVVPEDWVRPGVQVAIQRVQQQTVNGSLIVLHDGYCGGEDVAAIADQLIPWLLDAGYQFVTVDEFWAGRSRPH